MAVTTPHMEFTAPVRWHGDRRGPARWILSYIKHKWYLAFMMLFGAFANAALAAAVPVFTGQAFNAILNKPPDMAALVRIAIWIGVTQIVRGGLQFARNFSAELIGQNVERDIRHELYVSLLGKGMTFHSLQPVGDTMARATNDVREINLFFNPGVNLVVGSALFMVMPIALAPRYNPALLLVPALFVTSYFLALWQYLRELSPITSRARDAFGIMNTRLAEAIDGIETVKGMAQEQQEVERFNVNADRYRKAFVHQGDVEARFMPLLLLGLAEAGSLLHSLLLFQRGLLDVGQVVAYFGLIQLFAFPTFVSLTAYSQISLGIASAKRILELINRQTDLDQNEKGYRSQMRGAVEFRNVRFQYDGEEPALDGITFSVKPGQTVAIVGQTGAGKTTLAKLVNRTYDVSSGQVLVDGIDVREWNLEALRKNISIIEQDIFLFSRTIAENIAFGDPGSQEDRILRAARAAQADDFIVMQDQGYQTIIGERGVTLSGGQRQRLALARAFFTDPRILILDDSTSAIDSATEDRIQRAILTAARGRTTFIITHRLSQIRWADLILVLRNGRLIAMGTHDELMKTSEGYRRIFSE